MTGLTKLFPVEDGSMTSWDEGVGFLVDALGDPGLDDDGGIWYNASGDIWWAKGADMDIPAAIECNVL